MKKLIIFTIAITVLLYSCTTEGPKTQKEQLYKIETIHGDIIFKLYDETPLHKENFIKLIEQNYFDGVLFHRVINGFMIQGGDPDSRNAKPGELLGNGGPDYTIPAEFIDTIFHKKGVIAAAREGDDVNPEMRSAGSQFYIVQGKVFTDEDFKKVEDRINATRLNNLITKKLEELKNTAFETGEIIDNVTMLPIARAQAEEQFKNEGYYTIPKFKKEVYRTIGGTPHLDMAYTVFGEVIEGLDVINKIAAVETDLNNRPVKDIKMKIKKL